MNTTIRSTLLPCLLAIACTLSASAQKESLPDSTGLPGDQFDLTAALDAFKNAADPEQFEQSLNTADNHINNLDLDDNGEVDYVSVASIKDGDAVAVVLRVVLSPEENQDVAVIELEKTEENTALVQIRGDEELYPDSTIIEPFEEKDEETKGARGPMAPELVRVRVTVNVWSWAPVPWYFGIGYRPYVSAWYWGHWPGWWVRWHPHPWHRWHGWHAHGHGWYRPWPHCRVVHAHAMYTPHRAHSVNVHARYADAHARHARTRSAARSSAPPAGRKAGKAAKPQKQKAAPGRKTPVRSPRKR